MACRDNTEMSRTKHHGNKSHIGHDYGGRFNCNKGYGAGYGKDSRKAAHVEMRQDAKRAIRNFTPTSTKLILW